MSNRWLHTAPTHCEICKKPLKEYFVDGKTVWGPWAIMCFQRQPSIVARLAGEYAEGHKDGVLYSDCYHNFGIGLGTGRGQRYDLQTLDKLEG